MGFGKFKEKRRAEGTASVLLRERKHIYNGKQYCEFTGYLEVNGKTIILTLREKEGGGFVKVVEGRAGTVNGIWLNATLLEGASSRR